MRALSVFVRREVHEHAVAKRICPLYFKSGMGFLDAYTT